LFVCFDFVDKLVKPSTYDETVENVKNEGYVILYGSTGCGKSTLAA
jgi:ABC-type sugar transport system ATPase subunit